MIHLFSVGYMSHDKSPARYFAYLNLFLFNMLVLVLADNLLLMFVGWEGVGLCSYLLIGFWFQDEKKALAGNEGVYRQSYWGCRVFNRLVFVFLCFWIFKFF